jgi:hypothetical protein
MHVCGLSVGTISKTARRPLTADVAEAYGSQ